MKPKPGPTSQSAHNRTAMTERQAMRIARGIPESSPEDYQLNTNEDLIRAREARSRLEDLKLAKELGIDPASLE